MAGTLVSFFFSVKPFYYFLIQNYEQDYQQDAGSYSTLLYKASQYWPGTDSCKYCPDDFAIGFAVGSGENCGLPGDCRFCGIGGEPGCGGRGMIRMMNQDREIGPVNLGNPVENSMIELATKVLEITGSRSELKHVDLPADDPKQRCPDISRARRLLDWSPKVDLDTGLRRTVQYYRDLLERANSR